MSSTHQWRTSLVWNFMLIVAVLAAVLAIAPTASFAHPGHDHGLSSATGRMPGVPDYQKIDGVVSRFDPQSREYILRKPGEPAARAHVESDVRPVSEGVAANGGYSSLPSGEIQPSCATSGHRIVVVNAYDAGTKTADAGDAHIRSLVKRMNWKFVQQSQLSSQPDRTLQMKVDCDGSGATTVTDVAVPFGYKSEGIDTTDGDIGVLDTMLYVEQKLGEPEGANSVKYLIFNDKNRYPSFVGVGYKYSDATKSSSNINLKYTSSAFISRNPKHTLDGKDSWESTIPVHELLHVMGAALNYESEPGKWIAAPYATTGSHCIDGIDILCYSDGGTSPDGSYSEGRCPAEAGHESAERVTLDCGFDTYFDAETESGEWLSKWWNVGGSENPFLVYTPGTPPVATAPQAFTTAADFETYSATLKGLVNPGGVATTYKFEYGTTTSYGSSVPASPKSIGSGIDDVQVSETIKTEPEVTYHYRVVATNSKGTFYGEDKTVTTSHWEVQPIEGPSSSKGRGELSDISCSSSIHCVAVGSNSKGAPLSEQWDGSQWTIMANVKLEGGLERVSCSSASFCMATGKTGSTLFSESWNGSSWSSVSFPIPVGSNGSAIEAISCTSSTACVAVGRYSGSKGEAFEANTLIERWNGSEWTIVPSPNVEGNAFSRLWGVSCTSATSCLAVGSTNKTLGSALSPLVQKWDGSKWTIVSAPTPPGGSGSLQSVSCPAANFCMASGAGGENLAFAASWDGVGWKAQGSGLPNGLRSISCATQSSCELVGSLTKGQHWNGSSWTTQDLAAVPGGENFDGRRVSCPGPSLCTAVGRYTGVPFFSPGTRPLAERLIPSPHVKFRAEKYISEEFSEKYSSTATAEQSGSHKFTNEKSQTLTCSKATAAGAMSEPSITLALAPAYKECNFLGTAASGKANSCKYVFLSTNDKEPFTGSVDIACSKENDGIEFTTAFCTLKIPAQKALGTLTLANTGKKSRGRTITATLSLSGVEHIETSKIGACGGTYKAGTYVGTYVISGSEAPEGYPEEKEPVGLYMANEQVVVPPLVEAEKYSAVVGAEGGTMAISMGSSMSFNCASTGKGQGLLGGPSKEANLIFQKWTGCYWGGGFSISMNGCSFVLRPLVGQLPYTTGSLGITCPTGKEIMFTTPGGCEVKIPSQSNLSSIKTENVGSGTSRAINANLVVKGLTYTQGAKGVYCQPGTRSDGSLGGTWNLKGYANLGTQVVEGELKYIEGAQRGIWAE